MEKVIFVDKNGVLQAPMAAEIMKSLMPSQKLSVYARGLMVHFSEPLNPKAETVLKSNNIEVDGFTSSPLTEEDFTENTLVFTMEERQKQYILQTYENATEQNVMLLSSYVGEELEIIDPYGGTLQTYGLCFESLKTMIVRLIEMLKEENR